MNALSPNPVDAHVGLRLRQRRILSGMSQMELAKLSGLAFQQVQKYENGKNRMSASRLFQMAAILGVSPGYFFEDISAEFIDDEYANGSSAATQTKRKNFLNDGQILQRRETLEMVRAYYRIADPEKRGIVFKLIRSISREKNQK